MTPGNTVDSNIIISFFLIYLDIVSKDILIKLRFGFLLIKIGVGTVTIKKLIKRKNKIDPFF